MFDTILVLTLCLTSNPDTCRRYDHPIYDVSLMQCMTGAQAQLPNIMKAFPKESVKKYRCVRESMLDRDI